MSKNKAFKHRVIHPSVDITYNTGPSTSTLNPTFLSPRDPRLKPLDSTDQARHDANMKSGLVSLLNLYGIPTDDCRRYNYTKHGPGNTTVTASNVQPTDLETYYRWKFYNSIDDAEDLCIDTMPGIKQQEFLHTLRPMQALVLYLPHEWMNPRGPSVTATTLKLLKLQLESLPPNVQSQYRYIPRRQVEALPYPEPVVTLNEALRKDPEAALRVEWTLLKVLAFPNLETYHSEIEVERHVGSNIAGFFQVPNCTTSSNQDVVFPTAIGCLGSHSRPDFACRMNDSRDMLWSFRPVVLAGEAKIDSKLPSETEVHRCRVAAQLACTVQPTLILMILGALTKWNREKDKKLNKQFHFPFHPIIHGVAYDKKGVLIFAFFPRLLAFGDDGYTPYEWGFGCTLVSESFTDIFNTPSHLRLEFAIRMLMIQRHATYLSKELSQLEAFQVEELIACNELWNRL